MLCDVVLLRRDGMRLKPPELAPAVRGTLATQWMAQSSLGRPTLVANLFEHLGETRQRALLHTLLDVQLEFIADGQLSLSGLELDTADGRLIERRQVWRCTPVAV